MGKSSKHAACISLKACMLVLCSANYYSNWLNTKQACCDLNFGTSLGSSSSHVLSDNTGMQSLPIRLYHDIYTYGVAYRSLGCCCISLVSLSIKNKKTIAPLVYTPFRQIECILHHFYNRNIGLITPADGHAGYVKV